MAAPRKREFEHKFLARIDQPLWDKVITYSERKNISANDALNEVIDAGVKRKRL